MQYLIEIRFLISGVTHGDKEGTAVAVRTMKAHGIALPFLISTLGGGTCSIAPA